MDTKMNWTTVATTLVLDVSERHRTMMTSHSPIRIKQTRVWEYTRSPGVPEVDEDIDGK